MKRIPDEIIAKSSELQTALVQASMAGDAKRGKQLNREYEALMQDMTSELHGKRKRDPAAAIADLIKTGSTVGVGGSGKRWRVATLFVCDAISHGECTSMKGPLVVNALATRRDGEGRIELLILRGEELSVSKRLRHLGSVAADSGSMLVLDGAIADLTTSETVKRSVRSAGDGERVRAMAIDELSGWLVTPGFGSGGFDVYASDSLVVIDFLRIRDDPGQLRH